MSTVSLISSAQHVRSKAQVARGLAENSLQRAAQLLEWELPGAAERLFGQALKYEADAIRFEKEDRQP